VRVFAIFLIVVLCHAGGRTALGETAEEIVAKTVSSVELQYKFQPDREVFLVCTSEETVPDASGDVPSLSYSVGFFSAGGSLVASHRTMDGIDEEAAVFTNSSYAAHVKLRQRKQNPASNILSRSFERKPDSRPFALQMVSKTSNEFVQETFNRVFFLDFFRHCRRLQVICGKSCKMSFDEMGILKVEKEKLSGLFPDLPNLTQLAFWIDPADCSVNAIKMEFGTDLAVDFSVKKYQSFGGISLPSLLEINSHHRPTNTRTLISKTCEFGDLASSGISPKHMSLRYYGLAEPDLNSLNGSSKFRTSIVCLVVLIGFYFVCRLIGKIAKGELK
jgi:hypothetical protein